MRRGARWPLWSPHGGGAALWVTLRTHRVLGFRVSSDGLGPAGGLGAGGLTGTLSALPPAHSVRKSSSQRSPQGPCQTGHESGATQG